MKNQPQAPTATLSPFMRGFLSRLSFRPLAAPAKRIPIAAYEKFLSEALSPLASPNSCETTALQQSILQMLREGRPCRGSCRPDSR